jgi:hypothetical protein
VDALSTPTVEKQTPSGVPNKAATDSTRDHPLEQVAEI